MDFTTDKMMSLVRKVCKVVHSKAIVHRDVRLGNIVLLDGPSFLLIDWGFACRTGLKLTYHGNLLLTASKIVLVQYIDDRLAVAQILTYFYENQWYKDRALDDNEVVVLVNKALEPWVEEELSVNITIWSADDIEARE